MSDAPLMPELVGPAEAGTPNPEPGTLAPARPSGLRPPWRPGEAGNPRGRPRGLVRAVQKRAGKDGQKLVEALWVIAYAAPDEREKYFGEKVHVRTRERILALEALLDRGFGRPAQSLDVSGHGGAIAAVIVTGVEQPGDEG
jgi:hypothetical protein